MPFSVLNLCGIIYLSLDRIRSLGGGEGGGGFNYIVQEGKLIKIISRSRQESTIQWCIPMVSPTKVQELMILFLYFKILHNRFKPN